MNTSSLDCRQTSRLATETNDSADASDTIGLFDFLQHIQKRGPAARSIVDSFRTLSYQDLLMQASSLCHELYAAGITRGTSVAVILNNGADFVISAFAVWKCGAILVPLSPLLRETEFLKCLAGCSAQAIITGIDHECIVRTLRSRGTTAEQIWFYDPAKGDWTHEDHRSPISRTVVVEHATAMIGPDHPALMQYSTGTTGLPKRITRTHGQVIHEFRAKACVLKTTRDDRILGVAPFFHSHGLMNCAVLALFSGATLFSPNAFLPRAVARLIEQERITGFPGTPQMFQLLAELPGPHDFSSLRFALSGGAPLAASTAAAFKTAYGVEIRQHYGSTETGLITIQSDRDAVEDVRSVGRPLPGVSIEIVDQSGNAVPSGAVGQVKITSSFAATGYDTPSTGADSYFKDGSFFPGDTGMLTVNGELTLCGRHRGFINVGGNKVDPAEVEGVLMELSGVTEVAVLGVSDTTAGEKVKAVLIASEPLTSSEVRAHCARRLAPFKIPKVVEFRVALPKSPLGKVLKKYLIDGPSSSEKPP